jgi:isopentenyl-diphosphate delta-isomerase
MTPEQVILVDAHDTEIGIAEKLSVHRTGQLHRAVSVFLFDSAGAMWLQRRALHKYHTPGLWTNGCCTHPRPGEDTADAAMRCVREELGTASLALYPAFSFVYHAVLDRGLVEHEYDHVFVGLLDAEPSPNPDQVDAVRRIEIDALRKKLKVHPERFTPWFRIALEPVLRSSARGSAKPTLRRR